jgi:hypothetical protein
MTRNSANRQPARSQSFTIDWAGYHILIRYEPAATDDAGEPLARLVIETLAPLRAPLPIAACGHLSLLTSRRNIERYGDPVAYVAAWLDHEARARCCE